MSIAWLGWGRASGGSASAEHRNAQRRPARAKFSEASQRLSTTAHGDGKGQLRPAPRRHSSGQRSDGTALVSAAMARNRTASAKHGHAMRGQGGESLRKGLARQVGEPLWHSKATHSDGYGRPGTAVPRIGTAMLCYGLATQPTASPLLRGAMRGVAWQRNAPETAGKHAARGANAKND